MFIFIAIHTTIEGKIKLKNIYCNCTILNSLKYFSICTLLHIQTCMYRFALQSNQWMVQRTFGLSTSTRLTVHIVTNWLQL